MARKAASKPAEPAPLEFEQALHELEGLVEQMEQGDLSLEQSLQHFERGIELTRLCRGSLDAAQQKVSILLEKSADAELTPFDPDEDDA